MIGLPASREREGIPVGCYETGRDGRATSWSPGSRSPRRSRRQPPPQGRATSKVSRVGLPGHARRPSCRCRLPRESRGLTRESCHTAMKFMHNPKKCLGYHRYQPYLPNRLCQCRCAARRACWPSMAACAATWTCAGAGAPGRPRPPTPPPPRRRAGRCPGRPSRSQTARRGPGSRHARRQPSAAPSGGCRRAAPARSSGAS